MLHLTWFEFFTRVIPEAFFIVLAVHAFSKQSLDKKKCFIAAVIYAIMVFLVRELPILFGIHTFINLFALIVITCCVNKIKAIVSFRSSIITTILLYISELINLFLIRYGFHLPIEKMYANMYVKTLYTLPSLLLFGAVSIIAYYLLVVKKVNK